MYFLPPLAACAVVTAHPMSLLIFTVPDVLSFLLILFASMYLRYMIVKSNRFIHGIQRSAADRKKAVRVGRLVEESVEQVKPTISVLITGGIDGLFELITIIGVMKNLSSPATLFVVGEITAGLFHLQLLTHLLCFGVYNKEIRKKLLTCYPNKQSRVIVLNTRPQIGQCIYPCVIVTVYVCSTQQCLL